MIQYTNNGDYMVFHTAGEERLRIDNNGKLTLSNSEGIQLSAKTSSLYTSDGSLSYYATNNAVYLNGAGASGWLRLSAAGTANNRTAINIYGHSYATADQIDFRTNSIERLKIDSSGNITAVNTASGGQSVTLKIGASNASGVNDGVIRIVNGGTGNGVIQWDYEGNANRAQIYVYRSEQELRFTTAGSERLRITSGGVVKIGGDVSNAGADVGTVTKLTIKQHTNTHEGGMYIERSGERRGWYMYVGGAGGYNDAFCLTTNQLGTDTNVLAIDRGNRLAKLGGDVIIDSTNNGYGGLRIYDDSSGGYNVNYVGGRSDGNMSHVFKSGGRSQNQSPWTDATGSEIMRISLSNGLQLQGDTDSGLQYHTGNHYKFRTKDRERLHIDNRGVVTAPKLSTKALIFSSCTNKWASSRTVSNFVMQFYTGASSATYHFMRMISQPDWGFDDVEITQYRYQYNPSGSDHTVRRYYTYYGGHSEQIVRYNQNGSGTGTGNDNYINKRTDFWSKWCT